MSSFCINSTLRKLCIVSRKSGSQVAILWRLLSRIWRYMASACPHSPFASWLRANVSSANSEFLSTSGLSSPTPKCSLMTSGCSLTVPGSEMLGASGMTTVWRSLTASGCSFTLFGSSCAILPASSLTTVWHSLTAPRLSSARSGFDAQQPVGTDNSGNTMWCGCYAGVGV